MLCHGPHPLRQGRELSKGKSLQDCGVNTSDPVVFVRKVLVAEGAQKYSSETRRRGSLGAERIAECPIRH